MDQGKQYVENSNQFKTNVNSQITLQKRTLITVGVIALVLLAAIWIWKSIEIKQLNTRAKEAQIELKKDASVQVMQSHKSHLNLLAKPFVCCAS